MNDVAQPETMRPTHQVVKLSDIVFDENVYPRRKHDPQLVQRYTDALDVIEACAKFIQVSKDMRLVDGRHRHLAYHTKYATELDRLTPVYVWPVSSDKDVFELACNLNSEAGWQMTEGDKRDAALRMYSEYRTTQEEIAKKLHVRKEKVTQWLSAVLENERKQREDKMWEMWLACHEDPEIGTAIGVTPQAVGQFLHKMKEEFRGNHTLLFRNFEPCVYNVWNFPKLTNQVKIFGSIPQEIIDNLLYYFTNPFDVVFDPFGGGGSTIDKCIERKRRYYVSDLSPVTARANEIRQWDIAQGLPVDLPVPDLVFLDPPYWKQAERKYSEKPEDLGNVDLDAFLATIGNVAKNVKRKWNGTRPNGRLALIIGEYKHDGKYIDLPFLCYQAITKYLEPVRRIQVPYSTEVHGGAFVKMAKEAKEILYLSRDLMVFGPRGAEADGV